MPVEKKNVFLVCTSEENHLSFPVLFSCLSVILVLDLSKPNALWGTMEKLLQAAQAHLKRTTSQVQKSKPGVKHQTPSHSAARVLPKDYPVRPCLITHTILLQQFYSCVTISKSTTQSNSTCEMKQISLTIYYLIILISLINVTKNRITSNFHLS